MDNMDRLSYTIEPRRIYPLHPRFEQHMLAIVFVAYTIIKSELGDAVSYFDYWFDALTSNVVLHTLERGRGFCTYAVQMGVLFEDSVCHICMDICHGWHWFARAALPIVIILDITPWYGAAAAPIGKNSTEITSLTSAIATINATVSHASAQGVIQDSGILDDIERLLNIIGDHVERIRGPYVTNSTHNGTYTTSSTNATYPLRQNTTTPSTVVSSDAPGTKTTNNKAGSTTIVNPPSFAEIFGSASDKNITIHCKGVSVCNPVTVVSDKNGTHTGNASGNGKGGRSKQGIGRKIG
jgi:hypothetical protein